MKKPTAAINANTSTHSLMLEKANHLVSEFERLLASELHLLKTGQGEGLEAIADAKQSLVEELSKEDENLIELFNTRRDQDDVQALMQRLAQCQTENRNNHALVMLELKHTNKSLELLRSVLKMDDLSLYSALGKLRVNRERRRFGSA